MLESEVRDRSVGLAGNAVAALSVGEHVGQCWLDSEQSDLGGRCWAGLLDPGVLVLMSHLGGWCWVGAYMLTPAVAQSHFGGQRG